MTRRLARPLIRGTHGVCACGHPLAASAALEVSLAGGGAVDAAIAAAAALAVVLPEACGIGGEAMMLVARDAQEVVAINGAGRSPAALQGPIPPDGGGTVAVPAAVAAWLDALDAFGRLEPEQVLAPAVRLAREGSPLAVGTVGALEEQHARLARGAPGYSLLSSGLVPGSTVVHPELATTLRRIGAEGRDSIHAGELAAAIVDAVRADGGVMSLEDLARHASAVGPALTATRMGLDIAVQPPGSQAALALLALGAIERLATSPGSDQMHVAVEALEAAFEHRDRLVDRSTVAELLATPLDVDPTRAQRRGGPRAYAHTTAITTADADGTVVSMLVSVFDDFGSAVLVPTGGFLLNDRLLGFGAPPNHPEPRKSPVSTLSPILVDDGALRVAMATPGADGQVQTLVQVCLMLAAGVPLAEALGSPRFRSVDGRLALEDDVGATGRKALAAKGHDLWSLEAGDARFGAVAAAGVDRTTGTLVAAADPRRETWAIGW